MTIPIALRRPLILIALLALALTAAFAANGRATFGVGSVFAAEGPCGAGTAFFGSAPVDTQFVEGDTWQGGTFTNIESDPDVMNVRLVATGDVVGRFPSVSGGATATIVFSEPIMVTGILWYGNHPPGMSLNGIVGPDTDADDEAKCTVASFVTDTITIDISESGGIDFWFQPVPGGGEGCTPGYWKNHLDSWVTYSPSQTVASVFSSTPFFGSNTLLEALQGGGGSGVEGATKILLRAAVASLLNAASPDVDFDLTTAQVISSVNAALASNDRATMLALAADLDASNNEGCPLN